MNYWRLNTDSNARDDLRTCDLWYQFGLAFTGDFAGSERRHDIVLHKLIPGDGVFMHHSGLGVVGYGIVRERWNRKVYQGAERQLYIRESFEYRIAVDWEIDHDCRENPIPIHGRLPYMGTYSYVNQGKWDIQSVLRDLHRQASMHVKNNSDKHAVGNNTGRKTAITDAPADEVA